VNQLLDFIASIIVLATMFIGAIIIAICLIGLSPAMIIVWAIDRILSEK